MPTIALEAWCRAWQPRSSLSVSQWSRKHVKLPHSPRAPFYDPDQSYWLNDPLDSIPDTSTNEEVLLGPPGSAKSTLVEAGSCYIIAEDPGPTLVLTQTKPTTDTWFESRGKPVMKACKPVCALWPTGSRVRERDKTDTILYDHMPYWTGAANVTDTQSRSCRFVIGDEVWLWDDAIIRYARARLHDRWNGKVILVSQGGDEKSGETETELFKAWKSGTMEIAHFTCPHCGHVQPWDRTGLRYSETKDENGVWDYDAAAASAHWVCANPACAAVFPDQIQVRRQLSSTLRYIPTNPKPSARKRSRRYTAYCVWWISWGTLAIEWIKANEAKRKGDLGPLKTFIIQREANFWQEEITVPHGPLKACGYLLTDYMNGEQWPGELYRAMAIDKQLDHFIVIIRAWKQDGSSRLLFEGRINTESGLIDLQKRYKVLDAAVLIDARYGGTDVYSLCARKGWLATIGEEADLYKHIPRKGKPFFRYYSKVENVLTADGTAAKINFGNKPLKDILSRLRGGHGVSWETPDDVSHEYGYQIDSEVLRSVINKVTKQSVERYVKIRPNHRWDCEVLQILFACYMNLLGTADIPADDKPMPSPPVDNQT